MSPQSGFYTGEGSGAIGGTIGLPGFDELEKILYNLAGNAGLDILKKSWKQSIEPMRQEMIRRAPSDTGELKQNIRMRINRRSGYPVSYQIYVRGKRTRKNKATGKREVIGGAYWGHFVEWGVKPHWMPKGYTPSLKSKRFLRFMGLEGTERGPVLARKVGGGEKKSVMVYIAGGKKIVVSHLHHPGYKARPFMRPTFDEMREQTINNFGHNLIYAIQNYFSANPVGMGMAESLAAGIT